MADDHEMIVAGRQGVLSWMITWGSSDQSVVWRPKIQDAVQLAVAKMREDQASDELIQAFRRSLEAAIAGASGLIPESTIEPLNSVQNVADLPASEGNQGIAETVVVKLNGGLGTTMGITGAKATLGARDQLSFLDFTAHQILAQRSTRGIALPVIFMNSYRTHAATAEVLRGYTDLPTAGLPLFIQQGRVPKLDASTLLPVSAEVEEHEWCPPGHGELLALLEGTGLRERLLEKGYRFLFVSNSDNLGAISDSRIPDWMAEEGIPVVMEVCRRSASDMKGGHVARDAETGRLLVRDSNMVASGEESLYEDIARHRYFNTNCLWLDLEELSHEVETSGIPELPVIINRKTLNPADPSSMPVIQLETGMGTIVSAFSRARVVEVPRRKFIPVKTTNDLLVVRSDFFEYDSISYEWRPRSDTWPLVDLDKSFYRNLADFEHRFPFGPPGLMDCTQLSVLGDVTFGESVKCIGNVRIVAKDAKEHIPDNTVLS